MIRTPPILLSFYVAASVSAQALPTHHLAELLPGGARIIETANVPVRTGKTRALVLWMNAPRRVISTWDSAADFLYGDHWVGPTFLSLIDPSSARLINTLTIRPNQESTDNQDGVVIPFFTNNGFYYVPHPDKDRRGKPLLMRLRDLTGEGVAGQFVLFDHVVSGIAAGSVIGYSPLSDAAVQYAVERTQNRFNPVVQPWAVQVFDKKPQRAGNWKFTWEAGHGEWEWIDEVVHFDEARQLFVEKVTTRPYPGFAQIHCALDAPSLTNFLGRMRDVAPIGTEIEWLQNLIGKTAPNTIVSAGMAPTFMGTRKVLTLAFQVGAGGEIAVEVSTDSDFAVALRERLKTWCSSN